MNKHIIGIALALTLAAPAAAEERTHKRWLWDTTPNENGVFVALTPSQKFESAALLVTAAPADGGVCYIALQHVVGADPDVTALAGQAITINLRVDKRDSWTLEGEIVGGTEFNAISVLVTDVNLLKDMANGNTARLKIGDSIDRFSLAGSSAAIRGIAAPCYEVADRLSNANEADSRYFKASDPDAVYF